MFWRNKFEFQITFLMYDCNPIVSLHLSIGINAAWIFLVNVKNSQSVSMKLGRCRSLTMYRIQNQARYPKIWSHLMSSSTATRHQIQTSSLIPIPCSNGDFRCCKHPAQDFLTKLKLCYQKIPRLLLHRIFVGSIGTRPPRSVQCLVFMLGFCSLSTVFTAIVQA